MLVSSCTADWKPFKFPNVAKLHKLMRLYTPKGGANSEAAQANLQPDMYERSEEAIKNTNYGLTLAALHLLQRPVWRREDQLAVNGNRQAALQHLVATDRLIAPWGVSEHAEIRLDLVVSCISHFRGDRFTPDPSTCDVHDVYNDLRTTLVADTRNREPRPAEAVL